MDLSTDIITIKRNLQQCNLRQGKKKECLRLQVIKEMTCLLKKYFLKYPGCQVWLFGSVTRPFSFSEKSDIDIAVNGFQGSRLDLYSDLEALLSFPFDLVIMERSSISREIMLHGEKII